MTLAERIEQLVRQHGTLRAASRVLQVDAGYLSRLASGEKARPGKILLRRLGLRQVIAYERTNADAALQDVTAREERITPDPSTGAQPSQGVK